MRFFSHPLKVAIGNPPRIAAVNAVSIIHELHYPEAAYMTTAEKWEIEQSITASDDPMAEIFLLFLKHPTARVSLMRTGTKHLVEAVLTRDSKFKFILD